MYVDTLIIGAGVSGLTYALNCKEDYIIIEKEKEAGGLCRTFYENDFVWDFAGHFFHFANADIKHIFENEIDENDMVKCKKNTNINYYNHTIDYPFQANIHQLPKDEFIDCLYDLFHRDIKDDYNSFIEMLYGKFGTSITDKFLKPYNEKLYACDLNELDSDAMGRFFPYANIDEIINNMKKQDIDTYNSFFDYPKKGAKYFIKILEKKLDSNKVLFNTEVIRIDLINKKVFLDNGQEISFDKLINTMPLNSFVKVLKPQKFDYLNNVLSCNKVLVFNIGFDSEALEKNIHWTYFPDKDINFYRVGYYNNILGERKLSIYVEIGFKENDIVDVNKEFENTLINLKKCGIISNHSVEKYNSLIINPGYVHISNNSRKQVERFKSQMEEKNVYTIGRYGGWTYCSIEDCMLSAIELANKIK